MINLIAAAALALLMWKHPSYEHFKNKATKSNRFVLIVYFYRFALVFNIILAFHTFLSGDFW